MQIKQITALVLLLSIGLIQPITMGEGVAATSNNTVEAAKKPSLFDRARTSKQKFIKTHETCIKANNCNTCRAFATAIHNVADSTFDLHAYLNKPDQGTNGKCSCVRNKAIALHSELVELLHTQEAQEVISIVLKHIKK